MPEDMELGDDGGEEYVTDFKLHGYAGNAARRLAKLTLH
jgi:hypothetical protein